MNEIYDKDYAAENDKLLERIKEQCAKVNAAIAAINAELSAALQEPAALSKKEAV